MTISRWYWVGWETTDDVLDTVLERYVPHRNVNMAEARQKCADIEYLFGIQCKIESRSLVGTLPVTKRATVRRKEDVECTTAWNTRDGQLNDVLYAYCVSDRKVVRRLFKKSFSQEGTDAV
jgi:hypothetical protein